jgi:hypothetical protein
MVEQMHENGRKLTRLIRRRSGQGPRQDQPQVAEQPDQPATVAS